VDSQTTCNVEVVVIDGNIEAMKQVKLMRRNGEKKSYSGISVMRSMSYEVTVTTTYKPVSEEVLKNVHFTLDDMLYIIYDAYIDSYETSIGIWSDINMVAYEMDTRKL